MDASDSSPTEGQDCSGTERQLTCPDCGTIWSVDLLDLDSETVCPDCFGRVDTRTARCRFLEEELRTTVTVEIEAAVVEAARELSEVGETGDVDDWIVDLVSVEYVVPSELVK